MRRTETVGAEPVLGGNLGKDDRTGCLQAGDDRRVALRYGCTERLEPGGRRKPGDIDEILDYNRNSVQRLAPAFGLALGVERAGFF